MAMIRKNPARKTAVAVATLFCLSLVLTSIAEARGGRGGGGMRGGGGGMRGGGGSRGAAMSVQRPSGGGSFNRGSRGGSFDGNRGNFDGNRNGNFNGNRNGNFNGNFNGNTNVNRNANINVDNNWNGGCCNFNHPVAAGMVIGATAAAVTAAAVGARYYALPPSCISGVYGMGTYYDCGGSWYQPQYVGDQVTYVVVEKPE